MQEHLQKRKSYSNKTDRCHQYFIVDVPLYTETSTGVFLCLKMTTKIGKSPILGYKKKSFIWLKQRHTTWSHPNSWYSCKSEIMATEMALVSSASLVRLGPAHCVTSAPLCKCQRRMGRYEALWDFKLKTLSKNTKI